MATEAVALGVRWITGLGGTTHSRMSHDEATRNPDRAGRRACRRVAVHSALAADDGDTRTIPSPRPPPRAATGMLNSPLRRAGFVRRSTASAARDALVDRVAKRVGTPWHPGVMAKPDGTVGR